MQTKEEELIERYTLQNYFSIHSTGMIGKEMNE